MDVVEGPHVVCPLCRADLVLSPLMNLWHCEACWFRVTALEAHDLGARTPQEAANLKMATLMWMVSPPEP